MKAFIVAILLLSVIGCTSKDKKTAVLSMDKMQAVMWDIIRADVFTDQFIRRDTLKKPALENMQLQTKIFALHHVTREEYYKSYDYYVSRAELMKVILDSLTSRADRDRVKVLQRSPGAKPK